MAERASNRRDFKKGIIGESSRRHREEQSLAIRKEKKNESLSKRRNATTANEEAANIASGDAMNDNNKAICSVSDIPSLMIGLHASDLETQLISLRGFRKLVSMEKLSPVDAVVHVGAMPLFVQYLQRTEYQELVLEAAWILTNIASTEYTKLVVETGALPYLVAHLMSHNAGIRDQVVWCIGNIAGDCTELRDMVVRSNAIEPLTLNVKQPANVTLLRNTVWTLSNLCRGKPAVPLNAIAQTLPALADVIKLNSDSVAVVDAVWALSYVCDGDGSRIQAVVDLGVVPAFARMLATVDNSECFIPALRALGNIVAGNEKQTQAVLDAHPSVLSSLAAHLQSGRKTIRKESCWMLSNIAAGDRAQIGQLLATPSLVARLLERMSSGSEWETRREAAWTVTNIATTGFDSQVAFLAEHGAIGPLCDMLDCSDVHILSNCLDALSVMLRVMSQVDTDRVVSLVEEADGINKLENLQEHENEDIYRKAVHILETYFEAETEEQSENLMPVTNINFNIVGGVQTTSHPQSVFSFGVDSSSAAVAKGKHLYQYGAALSTQQMSGMAGNTHIGAGF